MIDIKCKICSSPVEEITAFSNLYYKCVNCRYIFKSISCLPGQKEEKERYLSHENNSDNTGYVDMFNNFLKKAVFPFTNSDGYALDFGCGYGPVLSEILTRSGYKTDIYDKYFFPQKTWQNNTPKYNLITSTEVFEHINHPLIILKFLKTVLKPGGVISLMTQFAPAEKSEFKKWWYLRDSTHISFYSPRTFEMLALKSGLEILKIGERNTCTMQKKISN